MDYLEEKAIKVGNSKSEVKRRLMEAKSVLNKDGRQKFKRPTFNFEAKQLIGDGYALQWEIRRWPELPVSYENQQTSVGYVEIIKI